MQQINVNQFKTTGATSGQIPKYNGSATAWAADAGMNCSTQFIALSGGTASKTTSAFPFVVGTVMIELLTDNSNNGVAVYTVMWANMRSFNGTKTDNVTARYAKGPGNGGFMRSAVDRTSTGTVLTIGPVQHGTDSNPDGSGISSFSGNLTWPSAGRLRITAWEDTQA